MALKLILILSGRTLQRFEFKDIECIRIGRSEDCDVRIDNLGVSRHHCEIVQKNGFRILRDLESGNGTYVNGAKVTNHNLNNGDTISLGKFSLRYETDDQEAVAADLDAPRLSSAPDGAMTLQMDAQSLAKKHRAQLLTKSSGYLKIEGKDLVLEKSLYVLGREAEADIKLEGWFCPRVVALLIRDEQGFRLVDVSPTGQQVTVNGVRKRDVWLNDNDLILVRGKPMHFHRGMPVGRE